MRRSFPQRGHLVRVPKKRLYTTNGKPAPAPVDNSFKKLTGPLHLHRAGYVEKAFSRQTAPKNRLPVRSHQRRDAPTG